MDFYTCTLCVIASLSNGQRIPTVRDVPLGPFLVKNLPEVTPIQTCHLPLSLVKWSRTGYTRVCRLSYVLHCVCEARPHRYRVIICSFHCCIVVHRMAVSLLTDTPSPHPPPPPSTCTRVVFGSWLLCVDLGWPFCSCPLAVTCFRGSRVNTCEWNC